MPTLRRPWVVTFSVAAASTACSEPRPSPPVDPTPTSVAAAPGPERHDGDASTSSATTSAPPPPAPRQPWPFEQSEDILNPRVGGRAVLWNGTSCALLGDEDARTSGIQFAREPVPCPTGIETLLAQCTNGMLRRAAAACECMRPEGNPPRPPAPVDCPPT